MGYTADGIEYLISTNIYSNISTLLNDKDISKQIIKKLKTIPNLKMMASFSHDLTGKYEVSFHSLFVEIKHIIEEICMENKKFQKKINRAINKYRGKIIEDKFTTVLTLITQGYMDELGFL